MTTPRSKQIDLESTPYYHIVSRCVRRAYLCGFDEVTGKDYSHRKNWLVNRIKALSSIFSIRICAYAIMSNHYHLVLYADEKQGLSWSDEEVRGRWKSLFPADYKKFEQQALNSNASELIQQKIDSFRERLMSISFFMQCLNQNIARVSNREDQVTGRFWEGRFKSQALLDEASLLTAMAYVDLNPIRSKAAATPETSEFTSIYERIRYISKHKSHSRSSVQGAAQPPELMAFGSNQDPDKIPFKLSDYLTLVETTGRQIRKDKVGYIDDRLPCLLERVGLDTNLWLKLVDGVESKFGYSFDKNKMQKRFRTYSISGKAS